MAADAKPTTCGMLAIKANELKANVAIVLSLHGCSHAILPVFNAIDFTPQWTLSNVAQAGFAQPRDGYSGGCSFFQAEGTTMKDAVGGEGSAVEETAKSHVPPHAYEELRFYTQNHSTVAVQTLFEIWLLSLRFQVLLQPRLAGRRRGVSRSKAGRLFTRL